MAAEPALFRALNSVLVESIFWDARTDELAWVDITAGTFHRGRLDGPSDGSGDRVVALPAPVSAVQPARGGGFVAALRDRVVALDQDGVITGTIGVVEHAHEGIRFNEGKVDPFGRFVVGGMNEATGAPDAELYSFAEGESPRLLRSGFSVANGFEWSDAGDVMYVTDTATQTVYRAPYGPAALGDLEPHLRGHDSDGLALDADGFFWNAAHGTGTVLRWSPEGSVVQEVKVPAPSVTSVALGGPQWHTLFVGSARENLSVEDLAEFPASGSIFALDVGVPGRPVPEFGARSLPS